MKSFGVEVHMKDGSKGWVYPVEKEPWYDSIFLLVEKSHAIYTFRANKVASYFKYELCEECGHDLRDYCEKCEENCCNT